MYTTAQTLRERLGNNAFAWEERSEEHNTTTPSLFIPPLIDGDFSDVQIGDHIVFEEKEKTQLRSCMGLRNFVHIRENSRFPHITIFDNHNHALYFWIDAVRNGVLQPGFTLIHIDEHSDLWENPNILNREHALQDMRYAWEFTNLSCNVGNYIVPAIKSGLV